jgi:L-seryl-tRNA(Ser) seleniumtransferase
MLPTNTTLCNRRCSGPTSAKENFTKSVNTGANLVVYSGGKGVSVARKVRTSSTVGRNVSQLSRFRPRYGRRIETWDQPASLIDADSLSGVPRHRIGRGFEVGKEELVGLIRAIELYLEEDEPSQFESWNKPDHHIGNALESCSAVDIDS